jgi:hypothetical protein
MIFTSVTTASPIQQKIIKRVSALMKLEEKGSLFHENDTYEDRATKTFVRRKKNHRATEYCFRFEEERNYYAWVYRKSQLASPRQDFIELDDKYYVDIW